MSVDRRRFVFAGIGAVVGATMGGAKALARALTPASGAVTETSAFTYKLYRGYAMDEAVRSLVVNKPLDEMRDKLHRYNISQREAEAEFSRRIQQIGAHPAHTDKDPFALQWCRDCYPQLKQQAVAEHPHHVLTTWFSYYCDSCNAETQQRAVETTEFIEIHKASHKEYTQACSVCWQAYMDGRLEHPKFGVRGGNPT